ncbi:Eco57I restriction-modification methylase domain-containing protein [Sphingomonas phyllosphaerae]|uniref:Eco57I restriction-modification methylase domain-containing protein n=1 Tax=Sphingomonas phyllosphaerae TaxID=257003 RepID=UPI00041B6CF5|nr:TaqI-like C-terminal specificity domain-containing protein [Sphingomonas phyllosphaerae]
MVGDVQSALRELIGRFRDNLASYKKPGYNETQTRREFIDPLFELLGWDVANAHGYAEAYKHVVHEDRLRIGRSSKAPDYSFRVGGTRKFFLEAKKPSVDINKDSEAAFQLRRYAWSAKLPLSILTNFETLSVYDCRVKPAAGDKPSIARILSIHYDELPDRWSELSSIFSLDAIHKGAFDRFASAEKVRKGVATVDDDFLDQIEGWRDRLARAFKRRNRDLDTFDLNDAVQKTIDRLVFLRIAEDRGIEPYGRLKQALSSKGTYSNLTKIFREADKRYNSGIFHFDAKDGSSETLDTTTLSLDLDDAPLKEIIEGLYPPKSPYEFSVIPADILGQVYERFLGKTIKVVGRSLEIDDKPDVKNAGGVFYTPSYVVRHIVNAVLQPLLAGKAPTDVSGERTGTLPVRVLDPACGSGSFLIEVYQALLDWYLEKYVEAGSTRAARGAHPRIFQAASGEWRLTIAERKRILTTHIYGVDVDPQAVEVTKLSLLLKVLEGESSDQVAAQINFLDNQRVLPDLGALIRCGNSLIAPDFYGLFDPNLLSEDQLHKINVFSWQKAFPSVFRDGGFHAVVGNPPYGASLLAEEKQYLSNQFGWQSYQLDTYLVFLEQSLRSLLRDSGFLGMIIPNPWLTNLRQDRMRQKVFEVSKVHEIVHFTFPVFRRAKATVDTEIVILERASSKRHKPNTYVINAIGPDEQIDLKLGTQITHDQDAWRKSAALPINIFLDKSGRALAEKMREAGKELSLSFHTSVGMKPYQKGKGRPQQSADDVKNRIFDANTRLTTEYRQYLRGGDIKRFVVKPVEDRYIKYGEWLAEPRLSAGFDAPEKILMRQTGDSLVATVDQQSFLCMNNMHVLVPRDPKTNLYAVTAIINSRTMNWYYQTLNPEAGEALAEVKKANVDRLPLPKLSAQQANTLAKLTKRMSANLLMLPSATEKKRQMMLTMIESDFDAVEEIVGDLFNLNATDRKRVVADQVKHSPL